MNALGRWTDPLEHERIIIETTCPDRTVQALIRAGLNAGRLRLTGRLEDDLRATHEFLKQLEGYDTR